MPELSGTVLDPLACEQHLQEPRADPRIERSLSPPGDPGAHSLCSIQNFRSVGTASLRGRANFIFFESSRTSVTSLVSHEF
ncbi:hypothetical protein PUN28_016936 [Cardiocondyla obscurior]|uniref:Uncharacterized protein n=1 Tax=Cardiocondyla obscurior TaxID=286306 RepID=A0AAW2ENW4_9HYME